MKKLITLLMFSLSIIGFSFAGTPTIDGTFDGTGVWGSAVATANGIAGWNGVNVNQVYVTYDATYAYFAATFHSGGAPGDWQYVAFAINVGAGGGSACPWEAPGQAFGHSNKPDFVLIGRLGSSPNWAELRIWDGSVWTGGGNIRPADMHWVDGDRSYVEGRILLSTLGNPVIGDVQFYVGGNNNTQHGNFDSCPDDNVMTSWDSPTTISNYISSVTLPIQLGSFVGSFVGNGTAKLEWETISEINNYGFWIQKFNGSTYETIESSFQAGAGSTLKPQQYSWTDESAFGGEQYMLKQQDNDGLVSYFGPVIMLNPTNVPVEAVPSVFALNQNYPNPFNPSTIINYQLAIGNYTTLKVYNLIGKEVATLFNGYQTAGYHQVTFDGLHLSNGIYFYKLQSGNNVEVKKLTLVK